MEKQLTILDKNNTYIEKSVVVGKNVIIYPNNYIKGETFIGDNSIIFPNNYIENCIIGKNCKN